jgi:hypothetical protein
VDEGPVAVAGGPALGSGRLGTTSGGSGVARMEVAAQFHFFLVHDSSSEQWNRHMGGEKGATGTKFYIRQPPGTFLS